MAGRSPTQNTLKLLRDEGYLAAVVEHWNPHAHIRQDLFGIIDVIGIREGETIAVQSTSYSNTSARVKKIKESDNLVMLIKAGWIVHVHGWHKKKNKWQCRTIEICP